MLLQVSKQQAANSAALKRIFHDKSKLGAVNVGAINAVFADAADLLTVQHKENRVYIGVAALQPA